jgi:DNA-binding transcriptional LysR family regulator
VDLNDLYFFAMAVDHGGFAAAGRALRMPKSKLSRRVALLEETLGVRLIQRSTRRFSVTDAGQRFHAHCKAMLLEAEAARESVESLRAEPRGLVRLSCPVALLHREVAAMLAGFMAQCPRVSVQLLATNRPVDVIGESFDVALRVRPPPLKDSELVLKILARRRQCLVASPTLLKQFPPVAVPADLRALPAIDNGPVRHEYAFALTGDNDQVAEIRYTPRLVTDDMATLLAAAVAGVGVAQLPQSIAADALARGDLVELLTAWRLPTHIVHAVYPSARHLLPAVRALLDHLGEQFARSNPLDVAKAPL